MGWLLGCLAGWLGLLRLAGAGQADCLEASGGLRHSEVHVEAFARSQLLAGWLLAGLAWVGLAGTDGWTEFSFARATEELLESFGAFGSTGFPCFDFFRVGVRGYCIYSMSPQIDLLFLLEMPAGYGGFTKLLFWTSPDTDFFQPDVALGQVPD